MRYLLLLLLLLTLPARADDLSAWIEATRQKYGVPGASVVVIHKGQVVHMQGYGVTRLGGAEKVDPDTIFQVASVTKVVGATLSAVLVDEGKASWDEPILNYLPGFQLSDPYATSKVTMRDLYAHRSGMPAFQGDMLDSFGYDTREIIRRARYMPLSVGFRYRAAYNNLGISLAGWAAAAAGGGRWEDLMQRKLFAPLQMTRSGFASGPLGQLPNSAYPHGNVDGKVVSRDRFDQQLGLAPAGALTTTARDLSRWMRMFLDEGKPLLKPETVEEMFTGVMPEEPGFAEVVPIDRSSGFGYGIAFNLYHYAGRQIVEKGGARWGMRSIITMVPQEDLGIIVLCNLNLTVFPEAVRARVLQQYLGTSPDLQPQIWENEQRILKMFASIGQPVPPPRGPLSQPLKNYQGKFLSELYGVFTVKLQGDQLVWEGGPARYGGKLVPIQNNSFHLTHPAGVVALPEEVTFTMGPDGKPLQWVTESWGTLPETD